MQNKHYMQNNLQKIIGVIIGDGFGIARNDFLSNVNKRPKLVPRGFTSLHVWNIAFSAKAQWQIVTTLSFPKTFWHGHCAHQRLQINSRESKPQRQFSCVSLHQHFTSRCHHCITPIAWRRCRRKKVVWKSVVGREHIPSDNLWIVKCVCPAGQIWPAELIFGTLASDTQCPYDPAGILQIHAVRSAQDYIRKASLRTGSAAVRTTFNCRNSSEQHAFFQNIVFVALFEAIALIVQRLSKTRHEKPKFRKQVLRKMVGLMMWILKIAAYNNPNSLSRASSEKNDIVQFVRVDACRGWHGCFRRKKCVSLDYVHKRLTILTSRSFHHYYSANLQQC